MNTNPVMNQLKAELGAAFNASGLKNAEFARLAGCSEAMACRLRDPYESVHLDTICRGFKALGKRIEVKVVALLLAIVLPTAALAQPPCKVVASVTIHTYDGPIEIDELCMTVTSYASVPDEPGQRLHVEAVDLGDGIFKNGFDP